MRMEPVVLTACASRSEVHAKKPLTTADKIIKLAMIITALEARMGSELLYL